MVLEEAEYEFLSSWPGEVPDADLTATVGLVVGLDGPGCPGGAVQHEHRQTGVLHLAYCEEDLEIVLERYPPLTDDLLDIK